jgi:HTH-type transcriptional regulator/antitoxin HipB
MPVRTDKLIDTLRDKAFRDHFSEDQVYELLALQIRQLREKNGWTQEELGARVGLVQSAIARVENPDYTGSRISTLSKLARAFDVALIVRYAPFSELADWLSGLSPASFAPASFGEESLDWRYKGSERSSVDTAGSASYCDPYPPANVVDINAYRTKTCSAAGYFQPSSDAAVWKGEAQYAAG